MTKRNINGFSIHFPNDISTDFDLGSKTLKMTINKPCANMQTDSAAFEAWALILKANGAVQNVELAFAEVNINKSFDFRNLCVCQHHFMRFLYRVMKFQKQFGDWFKIANCNQEELDQFQREFLKIPKYNNPPGSDSDYNEKKGDEHILEKAFIHLEELRKKTGIDFSLFDQFPNGLFAYEISERNRVFNTGYFDLWGIGENGHFNLFELKKPGNTKAGILSELFFYANYAYDLLFSKDNFKMSESVKDFRGYDQIKNRKIKGINGVFLVTSFHSEIEKMKDKILQMMNSNSPISYSSLIYSMDENKFEKIKQLLRH
jgi:hypothetical protein